MVSDHYFGQFLSPQWNTGKFSADLAESSTQDPLCFFVVVILVPTEAAAAQQREEDDQQEGYQRSSCDHAHPLVWLEMAGTRDGITVLVMARAGLVAVDSVLARLAGHVAVGAVKSRVTEALSGDKMTDAIETVTAVVLTVLPVCAIGASYLTSVPNPAGVAVRAFSMNGVTVVTVFTGGTNFLAVFPKEAFGAELITPRPIPAPVTGDAASLRHLTRLLAFAVATPVPAVLTVKSSRTWFPAELPTVSRDAGTRSIGLIALSVYALAVPLTPRTPKPVPTLAASSELVARGIVAVTLDCTVSPSPARIAETTSRHGVTDGVDAAVAVVVALWTPDTRVASALPAVLVALALLA